MIDEATAQTDIGHDDVTDPRVFERAYALHRDAMLAAAGRVLRDQSAAEDVVQDVFMKLWLSPRSYDASRGSLRTYLMMVTRTRAIDRWRTRGASSHALERAARETDVARLEADDAADIVIQRDDARAAVEAVVGLPSGQRDAVLLSYGVGLTAAQVADWTGIPLGTAKSRLRLGLERARQLMDGPVAS
jgi:RNA polymerase sigma-70 factor (ECF subfamily)